MSYRLHDFQEEALERMKNGCILCGSVGSGKSITALAYYLKNENARDLYIITTARKRDDKEWEDELTRVGVSGIVDSWNNIKKYKDVTEAFFIFDEQRVVGKGAWAKTFIRIARGNRWILLSATPGDTWSDYIPVFVANGFYKNRTEFEKRHCVYSRFAKFPKIDRYIEQGRLTKIKNYILVDMDYLRPTIRMEKTCECLYDRFTYKDIMKSRWNPETNAPIVNASELCHLIRKVVNSDDSRVEVIKHLLSLHDRAIIFYNFNYELEILRNIDYGVGTEVAEWNGHRHAPVPDSAKWVYLVQYTAGAEGWNCIKTDTIIFFSLNYSYKIMEQARGRIDRVNTPYKYLYYYYLKSSAPIDIAIGRALSKKKNFNEKKWLS